MGAGFGLPGAREARWGCERKPDSGRRMDGFRGQLSCGCLCVSLQPPAPPPSPALSAPAGRVPGLRACGGGGGEGFRDLASVPQYQGGLQEIIPVTLQQGPCCTEVCQERDWGCRVSMVTASHSPSPGTRHMGEKPKPGGPSPVTNLSQLGRGCGTDSP